MVGRVGNNQFRTDILFNIKNQLSEQERLFKQISSNKRILKPSDDPTGTSHSMAYRDHLNRNEEYLKAADRADVFTNVSYSALDNANQTWQRINEIAISAADGTKSASDHIVMAEELEQLLQHLVQTGNTQSAGKYIFGGSSTNGPAFNAETDGNTGRITGVYYQGDNFEKRLKTKDGGSVAVNTLGSNAGDPQASGAFIDSNTGANAFTTVIELRDKLLNHDITGISGSGGVLEDVEKVRTSLNTSMVKIGGSQEVIDLDRNRILDENADIEQFLSSVEDADVAKLIMELNNVQNVYEAALSAGGRIMQTTLLRYI